VERDPESTELKTFPEEQVSCSPRLKTPEEAPQILHMETNPNRHNRVLITFSIDFMYHSQFSINCSLTKFAGQLNSATQQHLLDHRRQELKKKTRTQDRICKKGKLF